MKGGPSSSCMGRGLSCANRGVNVVPAFSCRGILTRLIIEVIPLYSLHFILNPFRSSADMAVFAR